MAVNLDQVLKSRSSSAPYQKSIKATVIGVRQPINYTSNGEKKSVLNCVIADNSKAVKVAVFDSRKFGRFTAGSGIIMRNVIAKPETDSLTVTSQSQIFPTSAVEVGAAIREEGMSLFRPPPADVVSIETALGSPIKTKVSIKGQIIKEEAVHQVKYNDGPVDIKNIYVKDSSKPNGCRVALWRETTKTQCRPGDYVHITNLVISTYKNEVSLQTTSQSDIQPTEADIETEVLKICSAYVEGENLILLTDSDDIRQMPVSMFTDMVEDLQNIEEHFMNLCKPTATIKLEKRGSQILQVDSISSCKL